MSDSAERLDSAIFNQLSEVIGEAEEPKGQPEAEGQTDEDYEDIEGETNGEEAESEEPDSDSDERSELEDGQDSELEQGEASTGDESEPVSESLKVEVDGEEYTVEAIRGLRDKAKDLQSGFTQKYQEVAKQRKEVEQKSEQAGQVLSFLENQLKAPLAQYEQVNWQELQVNNPAEYQRLQGQYRNALTGYNQVNNALKAFQDKAKQDAAEQFKRQAAEAKATLEEMHQDFENLYGDALQYAIDLGAPLEEVENEIRPWVINLAIKAMRSDTGKIQATPKPKSVKKTLKQRASAPVNPEQAKVKKAQAAAKRGNQQAKDFLFGKHLEAAGLFED